MIQLRLLVMSFAGALLVFCNCALSYAFTLPASGQTLCYDALGNPIQCAGTGQDAAHIVNPMSYADNGNGTVTDKVTGLMWQQQDSGQTLPWVNAVPYCTKLNVGGYTDWRVPSEMELVSIVNYGSANAAINTTYFPIPTAQLNSQYFSSDIVTYNQTLQWTVVFSQGFVQTGFSSYVRCVRGGQAPSQSLINNGNKTVTDSDTGLIWQNTEPGQMSWTNALSYCNGLSLGGLSGWRLPNVKELQSLTALTKYNPAINANTTIFPGAQPANYWTSTTDIKDAANNSGQAWYVSFLEGIVDHVNSYYNSSNYVRCVNGGQSVKSKIGVFRGGAWYLDNPGNGYFVGCGAPANPAMDECLGFGIPGDMPVVGDWNGNGKIKIGAFSYGSWYLDNPGNGYYIGCGAPANPAMDDCMSFGLPGDFPVVGDWNGNGKIKIGVFRNGSWYLDYPGNGYFVGCGAPANPAMDECLSFGIPGDIPVVGDWNGNGKMKIGVFRNGSWYLDYPGNGYFVGCGAPANPAMDECLSFGIPGDFPVVGDWNGDGKIKIGVFRNGSWYLDYPGNGYFVGCGAPANPAMDDCLSFGIPGDIPVVGKW